MKRKDSLMWKEAKKNILLISPMYIFTLLFVAGPLIYMIILSFMTKGEGFEIDFTFTLDNFRTILDPLYLGTFISSFKLAILCTSIIILIGYPFGYFMARLPKTWKAKCMMLVMIPFWTSALIRLYGWIIILRSNGPFDQVAMFFGFTEESLGILYTYPAVVMGMVYILLPFMILSVYSSAEKLDFGLIEAARDLGATPFRAFWNISFKLTLPGLLSGVILTFIPSMALFFVADILGGNKILLVGNIIYDELMKTRDWPFAAAMALILMLLTTAMIALYRKISNVKELEGIL